MSTSKQSPINGVDKADNSADLLSATLGYSDGMAYSGLAKIGVVSKLGSRIQRPIA